ncbi:MAG: hypothetical protein EHM45_02915 [Desulfobacteraceae bacterium]|nr:MAG: hypothetical protein EHM45_02915 [Desulfobacteraceae bacterium]
MPIIFTFKRTLKIIAPVFFLLGFTAMSCRNKSFHKPSQEAPYLKSTPATPQDSIPIQLAVGVFDPLSENGLPTLPPEWTLKQYPKNKPGYYILQFSGPVLQEWKDALIMAGVFFFDYIPQFAFILKMDEEALEAAQKMNSVRWIGLYQPGYRLHPSLLSEASKKNVPIEIIVSLFEGEDIIIVRAELEKIGADILDISLQKDRIKLKTAGSKINAIAKINGVKFIELAPLYKMSQ